MSEYQRYEFMTSDQPLTPAQLAAVKTLSSHIEASSTHAVVEYQWGDFKHDPIKVLRKYFDGFLYWANWGDPQLALRFPHGALPADLIADYHDLDKFITFTRHPDFDILDIQFAEMEGPDEWPDYELGSLISIRTELLDGDQRALYIVWLAGQIMTRGGSFGKKLENDLHVPPVPPVFGQLTTAQLALAELLQVPQELLFVVARHSNATAPTPKDDFPAWINLLPPDRCREYLLRLAHNEPGLSRLLVKELRELNRGQAGAILPIGERVSYATLLAESRAMKAQLAREEREQQQAAHQRHLQDIHNHPDTYWHQVNLAAKRGTGPGYDEAVRLLVELREAASQFHTEREFQGHFSTWLQSQRRRPALITRLKEHMFTLPTL